MYRVGRSVVSATTQTPASGPLTLETTPPISSVLILTGELCCALRGVRIAKKQLAIPRSTTPARFRNRIVRMSVSFYGDSTLFGRFGKFTGGGLGRRFQRVRELQGVV